jgi:hypothetical protein
MFTSWTKIMTLMVSAHLVSAQAIYSEVSSIYMGDVIKNCKIGQANFAD